MSKKAESFVHLITHSDQLIADKQHALQRDDGSYAIHDSTRHASHALLRIHNDDALAQVGIIATAWA